MASEREEAINLTDVTDSSSPPSNDDAAVDIKSEKEESKEVLDLVDGDSRKSSSGGDGGLKVLFLSSDTGGGHRASAESLAAQFELLFEGSSYDLLDLATEAYLPPYNSIVPYYKHLSAHPNQWKLLYGVSNSKAMERVVETNIKVMTVVCERTIRKKIKAYHPDVVVSVHPLQTSVPILSCAKISHETGNHLPMFTVVTDLGSAHSTWFANGVEKLFVGSTQIYKLALAKGIPEEKLILVGLPIRYDFAVESERLGDGGRMSEAGKDHQRQVREKLRLPAADRKTLLVMGGGEGVGSLSNIVNALYIELVKQRIDAVIMVVCGRNEVLKKSLEERNWDELFQKRSTTTKVKKTNRTLGLFSAARHSAAAMFPDLTGGCGDAAEVAISAGCIEAGGSLSSLRKILSTGSMRPSDGAMFVPSSSKDPEKIKDEENVVSLSSSSNNEAKKETEKSLDTIKSGEFYAAKDDTTIDANATLTNDDDIKPLSSIEANAVSILPLGFVKNMAEYMVAADVLISKAGPGTISEAAALSLPVMLTSFLPGQEEGNVDYVVEGGFGSYIQDTDPDAVAKEVALWLNDEIKMTEMSEAAKKAGHPNAARDIVQQIGDSTLQWKSLNNDQFTEIMIGDVDDDEKEKEEIAKIVAEEEEKLSADLFASGHLKSTEDNSETNETKETKII